MTATSIIGIGITPFGRHDGVSGRDQGARAARLALADAGLDWSAVGFAAGGSMDGGDADSLVSDLGLTGTPFLNVWNGCATGGSALTVVDQAIRSGDVEVGLVVGFDKHPRGAFAADPASLGLGPWYARSGLMLTTQFFGMKARRYLHDHDISRQALARVAVKAMANGAANEMAWRRRPLTEDEVLNAPMVADPLTQYMFCSPGEGATALVLCRSDRARERGRSTPIHLRGTSFASRRYGSFEVYSPWLAPERAPGPTVEAARKAFETAGIGPEEVDLAQLQDTDSGAEIIHMAESGLCDHGEQEAMLLAGDTEIGGRLPVNTDGGCLANGEPIGASGLRQVYETVLQLRGDAGSRQVPGRPRIGFTHVYGAPGVSACTVLAR